MRSVCDLLPPGGGGAVCSDYIKTVLRVSHQSPVAGQMGGVCVCGALCVGLGGANSSGL